MSVNGEGFLALAEAKNPCDISIVHKNKWETMTFNVFEMGTEEAVHNAFQVLSDGGIVLEPICELHGVNAVQLLLTNMEYVGGFQFDKFQFIKAR